LYALEVEELAYCLARDVHRSSSWSNYCAWSCGLRGLKDLTFFLLAARISQWYRCFCIDLIYLLGLLVKMPWIATTSPMAMTILWVARF
jgi:hypothetical protein